MARQRPVSVCKHEAGELFGRVRLTCFEPVDRHTELRSNLAQHSHTRYPCVGFDPADVCVADAGFCDITLAEAELNASLPNTLPNCAHRLRTYRRSALPSGKPLVYVCVS